MATFLDHLRSEQIYSKPFPGEIYCSYIPETAEIWGEISTRLIKDPDHRRQGEIGESGKMNCKRKESKSIRRSRRDVNSFQSLHHALPRQL